jgi:hypothetical protein
MNRKYMVFGWMYISRNGVSDLQTPFSNHLIDGRQPRIFLNIRLSLESVFLPDEEKQYSSSPESTNI